MTGFEHLKILGKCKQPAANEYSKQCIERMESHLRRLVRVAGQFCRLGRARFCGGWRQSARPGIIATVLAVMVMPRRRSGGVA